MEPRKIGEVSSFTRPDIEGVTKEELKKQFLKLWEKGGKDKIELSAEAKKISEYVEIIKKMPEVRKDKIKEVERKLVTGEYESEEVLIETLKRIIQESF